MRSSRPAGSSMRVLHIVESFGGGVVSAMVSYINSLKGSEQEFEHHLLAHVRDGDYLPDGEMQKFASVSLLPESPISAIAQIKKQVSQLSPDIVHAHSSFAGAYVRFAINKNRTPVVYTPHCYAFERQDINIFARLAYHFAEWLLSFRTSAVGGCSQRETDLALKMNSRVPAVFVPNVADIGQLVRNAAEIEPLSIVGVGRIGAQKDPQFFLRVIRLVQRQVKVTATWIGGGDASIVSQLEDAGVKVTGWLPRTESLEKLKRADLYVHTARWEGFAMSVLEANSLEVPILVRDISAFNPHSSIWICQSEADMAEQAVAFFKHSLQASNRTFWQECLAPNNADHQCKALVALYQVAMDS